MTIIYCQWYNSRELNTAENGKSTVCSAYFRESGSVAESLDMSGFGKVRPGAELEKSKK